MDHIYIKLPMAFPPGDGLHVVMPFLCHLKHLGIPCANAWIPGDFHNFL